MLHHVVFPSKCYSRQRGIFPMSGTLSAGIRTRCIIILALPFSTGSQRNGEIPAFFHMNLGIYSYRSTAVQFFQIKVFVTFSAIYGYFVTNQFKVEKETGAYWVLFTPPPPSHMLALAHIRTKRMSFLNCQLYMPWTVVRENKLSLIAPWTMDLARTLPACLLNRRFPKNHRFREP